MYKGEKTANWDRSRLLDFFDHTIVSYIDAQTYEDINKADLPEEIKQYIQEDNFVLCLDKLIR